MNWKNEAIERLSKYNAMNLAMKNIPMELNRLEKNSADLKGRRMDSIRVNCTAGRQEDILIGNLMKKDELTRSLENAKVWVDTTDQALSALTHEEELILRRMYICPQRGSVNMLCNELGVEQSSIYRKRDAALYHFTIALYGIS